MNIRYEFAYRFGFTPWEREEGGFRPELIALLDELEVGREKPYGKALDIGCGTGAHSIELAQRGWDVTGVDTVDRALDEARGKPGAEAVTFVKGDATRLQDAVEPGFKLLLDVGCLHGMKPSEWAAYGRGATQVAHFEATMIVFAFSPGRLRGPLPRGISKDDLLRALPDWKLEHEQPADMTNMPGPLQRTQPRWYRLSR